MDKSETNVIVLRETFKVFRTIRNFSLKEFIMIFTTDLLYILCGFYQTALIASNQFFQNYFLFLQFLLFL